MYIIYKCGRRQRVGHPSCNQSLCPFFRSQCKVSYWCWLRHE